MKTLINEKVEGTWKRAVRWEHIGHGGIRTVNRRTSGRLVDTNRRAWRRETGGWEQSLHWSVGDVPQWRIVSGEEWSMEEAIVLCRQLDCGSAVATTAIKPARDQPGPDVWIRCDGLESALRERRNRYSEYIAPHVEVTCSDSVRLVDGAGLCSGRVEVKSRQSWTTVCEADFDRQDAEVLCRELGCGAPLTLQGALFGEGKLPFGIKGSGVMGQRTGSRCAGEVQVFDKGRWRTLKAYMWRLMEAAVVCRQLDCGLAVAATESESEGEAEGGEAEMGLYMKCTGSESTPKECSISGMAFRRPAAGVICSEHTEVRLVDGSSRCAGTVEVFHYGGWRRVRGDGWPGREAVVVCRQLDCGSAVSATWRRSEKDWREQGVYIRCKGSESALGDCGISNTSVMYSNAVTICSDSVRLVDGAGFCSGRVEVKSHQSWTTECEAHFDRQDAEVVCRELGCGPPLTLQGALFGEGKLPFGTKEFQCNGTENRLLTCSTSERGERTCTRGSAVGLTCSEVRLVEGSSRCAGTVEVFHSGDWKRVTGLWSRRDAAVVCRQLDCGSAVAVRGSERREEGDQGVSVDCDGSESALSECRMFSTSVFSYSVLICSDSVRLVDGAGRCSGRVEVKSHQSWTAVCEADFDRQDAEVVCRELDCGPPLTLQGALFGEGKLPLGTKEFQCNGTENHILTCSTSERGERTCTRGSAVGLTCSEVRLVEGSSRCAGTVEVFYDGDWRRVRAYEWSRRKAAVVCRQLDCGSAVSATVGESEGDQGGPGVSVYCDGSESAVSECSGPSYGLDTYALLACSGNSSHDLQLHTHLLLDDHTDLQSLTLYRLHIHLLLDDHTDLQSLTLYRLHIHLLLHNHTDLQSLTLYRLHIHLLLHYHTDLQSLTLYRLHTHLLLHDPTDLQSITLYRLHIHLLLHDPTDLQSLTLYRLHIHLLLHSRTDLQSLTLYRLHTHLLLHDRTDLQSLTLYRLHIHLLLHSRTDLQSLTLYRLHIHLLLHYRTDLQSLTLYRLHIHLLLHDRTDLQSLTLYRLHIHLLLHDRTDLQSLTLYRLHIHLLLHDPTDLQSLTLYRLHILLLLHDRTDLHSLTLYRLHILLLLHDRTDLQSLTLYRLHIHLLLHSRTDLHALRMFPDSVRLVDGAGLCSGRVEVRSHQSWTNVCEADFDRQDAEVVCRELDCGAPVRLQGALYGEGKLPFGAKEFQCRGTENRLSTCSTSDRGENTCTRGSVVGLTCSEVRLVDGSSRCAGITEVFSSVKWRRVRATRWTMREVAVACRQLDCGSAIAATWKDPGDENPSGLAFECDGSESELMNCKVISTSGISVFGISMCSDSVRLVDGAGLCSGRVEVKSHQSWTTVCEADFDRQDAEVVCRELNCGPPLTLQGALYGKRKLPFGNKEFQCTGTENLLGTCSTSTREKHTCTGGNAVRLTCSVPDDVRLVDGSSHCAGTVEMFNSGGWRRVEAYGWSLSQAAVVCRQLDCGSAVEAPRIWSGREKNEAEWGINILCNGSESELRECKNEYKLVFTFAGVMCSGNSHYSVRLVDGAGLCSGRVEVKSHQSWTAVCEADFDQQDAEVVCRELNCGPPLTLQGALYGEGKLPFGTKEFQCNGTENHLLSCSTSEKKKKNTCTRGSAVGLTCSEPDDVRLVNGSGRCDGTVEMFHNGKWRTVNAYDWSITEVAVVCRQLGCGSAVAATYKDIKVYPKDPSRLGPRIRTTKFSHMVGGAEDMDWILVQPTISLPTPIRGSRDLQGSPELFRGDNFTITCSTQPQYPAGSFYLKLPWNNKSHAQTAVNHSASFFFPAADGSHQGHYTCVYETLLIFQIEFKAEGHKHYDKWSPGPFSHNFSSESEPLSIVVTGSSLPGVVTRMLLVLFLMLMTCLSIFLIFKKWGHIFLRNTSVWRRAAVFGNPTRQTSRYGAVEVPNGVL
ncbi:hypothetical protein NFI96_013033 [Prochilodus magdalenae]|nr:hypothetical protein NFI96_013033 [Prochilodus magdalenae]